MLVAANRTVDRPQRVELVDELVEVFANRELVPVAIVVIARCVDVLQPLVDPLASLLHLRCYDWTLPLLTWRQDVPRTKVVPVVVALALVVVEELKQSARVHEERIDHRTVVGARPLRFSVASSQNIVGANLHPHGRPIRVA